jgi:S-DNA-T family DNA segregation ATPase FtsK/SpoIIIE
MARSITVTELTCACLDEQWRRRWLKGGRPSTRSFSPPGELPAYGSLFHRLVDRFVQWLLGSRRKASSLREPAELWHELYERFAAADLERTSRKGHIDSAYHLSEALKAFCARISALRSRTPSFATWQNLYLANEFLLKDVELKPGSSSLLVSGRLDAVRFHPELGIEVVDYKLTHGSRMKHDLLQLAIYTRLLEVARPGLKFVGTLEYYEPKLHEVTVSRQDLEALFEEMIRPILDEIAGKSPARPARPGDREAAGPAPAPEGEAGADRRDLSEAIKGCFADFKLEVDVVGRQEAPQLVRYRVKPAPGVKVVSLASRADDLKVALALRAAPVIEPSKGSVVIDIPKESPDTVYWREVVRRGEFTAHKSPVAFPVGVAVDNTLLAADFADPNMCHCLVAGAAGSGKSEFLKSLAASLISRTSPATLRLTIIDPKILTFGGLPADLAHLSEPVVTDISAAIPCLEKAVSDMERRYRTLAQEGFENLSARLSGGRADIPYHVIIFDEFGDLILAGKEEKKEFERLVGRIAQMGRAAGIHLVLTTQRPDRNVVTGLIKANLPLKVCMRVVNSTNSTIVLDQIGGEKLLGRGDLLCDRGRGVERAQSPYVTQEELRALAEGHLPS